MKKKNGKKKVIITSIVLVLLTVLICFSFIPLFSNLKFGLDLQGGFEILYKAESIDGSKMTNEKLTATYKTLSKRIDSLGVSEPEITIEGSDKIVGVMGSNPSPILLLFVIFVVTCVLTNFMSNTATTALMVPIAVSLAESLNADPRAVIIATVIAGSCAYATPIGMPANTMVVGVGGYKFKDYVKSGLPLILVSFVLCMILLPILYPFYP